MHDVWPVLFIAYRSEAEDVFKALKDGTLPPPSARAFTFGVEPSSSWRSTMDASSGRARS